MLAAEDQLNELVGLGLLLDVGQELLAARRGLFASLHVQEHIADLDTFGLCWAGAGEAVYNELVRPLTLEHDAERRPKPH